MSDVAADPICQSPRGGGGTVLGFGGDGEDRKTETRLWSEVSHLSFLSRSIWPDRPLRWNRLCRRGNGRESSAFRRAPSEEMLPKFSARK